MADLARFGNIFVEISGSKFLFFDGFLEIFGLSVDLVLLLQGIIKKLR